MRAALAAAVAKAQAASQPKQMEATAEDFDPLEFAAQEFAEATTPAQRAEAALALVTLAQHKV
jgi:hypothetical protein